MKLSFETTQNIFRNRPQNRQQVFDISILPLNLSEGRNIGELPGLFLYKAPQKSDSSKQSDVLVLLLFTYSAQTDTGLLKTWADIISNTYFSSRGSITTGINEAVKKLSAYIKKENKNKIPPSISMNLAVIRDRTIMFSHAGPVHSTVISADNVQNFSNEACLPIQLQQNELSFFTSDIHTEDIILLCPKVPSDWTNSAIMEVAGDSPLNAIRFLLDRSGGDLQAAVIQLRTGKGNITFRNKTSITANIQLENPDINEFNKTSKNVSSKHESGSKYDQSSERTADKPLMRQRKTADLFSDEHSKTDSMKKKESETQTNELPSQEAEPQEIEKENPDTSKAELPGSQDLPFDFTEISGSKHDNKPKSERYKQAEKSKEKTKPATKIKEKKEKFNLQRFIVILVCGLLIPIIVVSVLFFIYSDRSKDQLHREYLSLAVTAAQKALSESNPFNKESLWTEALSYSEQSLSYGTSPAAEDMRKEATTQIDHINGGISAIYSYANQNKLPQGLTLTEILSSGQYTYALDSKSGSVLPLVPIRI